MNLVKALRLAIVVGIAAITPLIPLLSENRWNEVTRPIAVFTMFIAGANTLKAWLDDSYRPMRAVDRTKTVVTAKAPAEVTTTTDQSVTSTEVKS